MAKFKSLHFLKNGMAWGGHLQTIVSLVFLAILTWFMADRITSYYEWPPKIYSDSEVYNLRTNLVSWDIYYGPAVPCETIDCHLMSSYPEKNFTKKMLLPAREFPLKDYKKGQLIYARARVFVPKNVIDSNTPLVFHSTYIFAERYECYFNEVLVDEGASSLLNISIPRHMIAADRHLDIAFKIDPGALPYQGLAHRGELLVGPKSKLLETAFTVRDLNLTSFLWFLLPKVTFTAMFIFIFLAIMRSPETFAFIVYAFLSVVEVFLRSGFSGIMTPGIENAEFIGMHSRNFSYLALYLFMTLFFRKQSSRHVLTIRILTVAQLALTLLSFTVMDYRLAYDLTDMFKVALLPFIIGSATLMAWEAFQSSKKSLTLTPRLKFSFILMVFFGAYTVFVSSEAIFLIMDMMGLNANKPVVLSKAFDLAFFFVLAAIYAVEIGYEISAKIRIENELRSIEERLALASSVQDMLLPHEMAARLGDYKFEFFYKPAEQMSGDWLHLWQADNGETRLFIGDVVGKGPSSALAVAVIASTLAECKLHHGSVEETLRTLNTRLIDLFERTISTTVSVIVLKPGSDVEIYNCGSVGWMHLSGTKVNYYTLRSQMLGVNNQLDIPRQVINCIADDLIFSFTDGCLEGARALKDLVRQLQHSAKEKRPSFEELYALLLQTGKAYVHHDDKTCVVVGYKLTDELMVDPKTAAS